MFGVDPPLMRRLEVFTGMPREFRRARDAGRGISLTNVALHPSGMAYFTDSTNGRMLRAKL